MVERALAASPLRYRFLCPRCRSALTPWVRELTLAEALSTRGDETWLLPGGFFASRDSTIFGDDPPTSVEGYPWLLPPTAKRWLATHPDFGRSGGCCGLGFRSPESPNLVCMRGHAVGIGYRECHGPQWYALDDNAVRQSEPDPHPLVDVGPKLARARALASRPPPPVEAFAGATTDVAHDAPDGWINALWLEAPALEAAGPEAAPTLVLRAKGLPEGGAVALAAPWPQLVRLLCLDETPWGSPDVPLTWKADGAPAVNVSRHDDLVLLTAARREQGGPIAFVFDADEWAGAWARLGRGDA